MALRVTCPACQNRFAVPDQHAGKKLRCQKCQHVFLATDGTTDPAPMQPQNRSFEDPADDDANEQPQKSGMPLSTVVGLVAGAMVLLLVAAAITAYFLWPDKPASQAAATQPALVPHENEKNMESTEAAAAATEPSNKVALPPGVAPNKLGTVAIDPTGTKKPIAPPGNTPTDATKPPGEPTQPPITERPGGTSDDAPVKDGAELPRQAKVGELFTFKLKDAKGTQKWTRLQSPEGLEISSDGVIRWTPTERQVGTHELVTNAGRFKITVVPGK
jgi:predicted Zn finger-like uncharacterized protein